MLPVTSFLAINDVSYSFYPPTCSWYHHPTLNVLSITHILPFSPFSLQRHISPIVARCLLINGTENLPTRLSLEGVISNLHISLSNVYKHPSSMSSSSDVFHAYKFNKKNFLNYQQNIFDNINFQQNSLSF